MDRHAQQTEDRFYPSPVYNGLMNQGATCYLNSVLQVLFMTTEFREAVKRHTSKNPDAECIELHLTNLFKDLEQCDPVHTYNITKKLGIDNVYKHQDAAEYFEKILTSLTSPEASQIFQGQLTHQNKCSKCKTDIETHGPFWSLPLELVDSDKKVYSVVEGIDKYFRALDVTGANQMYCDHCDAKSDATIKCVMKHHPEVLTLLLRKFKFDNFYMYYDKVRCIVDIPCTLQISEDQTYELYGFVEHFGDLRGGHYTATIKCQDEKWYSFDDTMVTPLPDNRQFQVDNIIQSKSAYLLFYRKKTAGHTSQDLREVSTNGGSPSDTSSSYEQCNVKTRKRDKKEEAAEGGHHTVDTQKNKKKRIVDDQESKQEQDSVHVDKQGDEKLVTDVKVDEESTTGACEREKASVSGKWNSDSFHGFQNNEGDSNISNRGISNTSPTRHEQQREEERDVKEDKEQMTRESKPAQTGDTSMTHKDNGNIGDDRKEQSSEQKVKEKEIEVLVKFDLANDFKQNKTNDEQEDKIEISDKFNVSSSYLVAKQGEKRDGKGDRQQKRGDNECAQRRETSKSHSSEGVEDKPQEQMEDEIGHIHVGVESKISTTGASERENASVSGKWNSDSFHGFQNNEGVGDSNISKNQGISNTSPTRHEQQREKERDVKEDMEQMTREFKPALMGDTSMTHQDNGNIGDDRKEQRSGQNSVLQPVCVENKGDEEVKEKESEVLVELYSDNKQEDKREKNAAETSRMSRQLSDNKVKREFDPKEDLDTLSQEFCNLKLHDSAVEGENAVESNSGKMAKEWGISMPH